MTSQSRPRGRFSRALPFGCAALVVLCCSSVAAGESMPTTARPAAPMPTAVTPAVVAPGAAPDGAAARYAVAVSLSRVLAPMFQVKVERLLSEQLVVGAHGAVGSPPRVGLTTYSQQELGVFAAFYALGSARKGFGGVLQARGFLSSGEQTGEDGADAFTASGSGFSVDALLSVRRMFASSLLLQADYGLTWLKAAGEATANGDTTKASYSGFGSLLNVWVGITF